MDRIVDISSDGLHLAIYRGFLTVSEGGEEQGRIALDDIGALIVHAHGTTWSNHVFVKMAERGVPVVLCGSNHAPVSVVWPLEGHHAQGARLRAQIDAPRPLQKQLWQKIVAAKIRMQGHVLAVNGREAGAFEMLARKVRSGDPDNIEAQGARRYWKALLGPGFYRDQSADGANALLNYGYTVLRAVLSRAICGSGLHPTAGIFHSNRANAFALADDLMEPYRPLVDQMVLNLIAGGETQVSNYLRFCSGKEQFETYVRKIEGALPDWGDIYIFPFTDRQYENIVRFSDQARKKRRKNPDQLALF